MHAKDFNTLLELEVYNIIDSIEANVMILKLKGQKLDGNTQTIIKKCTSMQFYLINAGKRRMKDAIEKEKKLATPQHVVCVHCNKQWTTARTGSGLNNGYICNIYYCKDCNEEWVDYIPVDENERLKWHLNFITQAEKLSKEKKVDIPPTKLEEMKICYQKMVEIQNDMLEKEAAASKVEDDAQKALLIFKNNLQDIATSLNEYVKRHVAHC